MFEKKAEDGFYFMKYDHEPQYTELCVDGTFLLSEIEEAIRG